MSELDNAYRTLAKAEIVLKECERYFYHQAAMNAQAHMSEKVMYSPIHSSIGSALHSIAMFNECYPAYEEESPNYA